MSRGKSTHIWRGAAVWLAVTVIAVVASVLALASWRLVRPSTHPAPQFADLLVALCAGTLLLALAWLWVVTTVTVVELMTGRLRTTGGATRRLVLIACGAAVLAGATAPAMATSGDGAPVLAGLPLPDRSVATTHGTQRISQHQRPQQGVRPTSTGRAQVHVVGAGESLWSIAAAQPGDAKDLDERWRAIWSANRDVIGADPDLILPGQQLRLPGPTHTDQGER